MKRLLAGEPTLIVSAVRLWLLFFIGYGWIGFTDADLMLFMAAVEGTLSLIQRALVTPETEARARVADATVAARNEALADVASLAAKPVKRPAKKATPAKR